MPNISASRKSLFNQELLVEAMRCTQTMPDCSGTNPCLLQFQPQAKVLKI